MGGGGSGNAGYEYYFGIHAGISRGECDELVEIRVGEKLAWQGCMTASGDGYIDAPELFGGQKKEGGIQGPFKLMMGEPTQTMPAELAAMIAPTPPTGFRRMVTFFYDGLVCALNPYPKSWSFRMRRAIKGWDGPVPRPDLAVIELEGPAPDDDKGSSPFGEYTGGVINVQAGAANAVNARIVPPPGWTIFRLNAVREIYTGDPFEPDPLVDVPYYGWVIQEDGSLLVSFHPRYYGQTFRFYTHSEDGPGRKQDKLYTAVVDVVTNPLIVRVASPGWTFTNVVNINGVPPVSQERNADGSITVLSAIYPDTQENIAPYALVDGSQAGGPQNTRTQIILDLYRDFAIEPIRIPVVPPGGGKFFEIQSVYTVTYDAPDDPFPTGESPQDINYILPYTLEVVDGVNIVVIKDIRAMGVPVVIQYVYQPILMPNANFKPARLIRAMNGAHIVFEALTNREWGRGWDRGLLNIASFEAAMQTLFDEKFGLCYKWSRRDSVDAFVQNVLDTIGAVIYSDPRTALITLKLIRADYDETSLKVWDTSNGILEITASNVNTSSVSVNEVIVKYRETVYNEDRSVNVQSLASLQSNGGAMNTVTKEYKGIPTTELARRVAQRDLRARVQGLRRMTIVMDRRGSDLVPGGVMQIRDLARNILPTVYRIATKKDGTLTDGRITFDVVQDVFSFPATSYVGEQPNTWSPPNFQPCLGDHQVFEAPYFLLKNRMSQADFAYVDDQSAYLAVVAERAKSTNVGFDLAVRMGGIDATDWPAAGDEMYCGFEPPAN